MIPFNFVVSVLCEASSDVIQEHTHNHTSRFEVCLRFAIDSLCNLTLLVPWADISALALQAKIAASRYIGSRVFCCKVLFKFFVL
jgi:hypothetical protein